MVFSPKPVSAAPRSRANLRKGLPGSNQLSAVALSTPTMPLVVAMSQPAPKVRVTGRVTKTAADESDTYFRSRPFESQIGAWASAQSQTITDRAALESRYAELAAQYAGGPVPLPPFWGGYRVAPEAIEFWQGREDRLHDRAVLARMRRFDTPDDDAR